MHSVTDSQADRQTDDMMMPTVDNNNDDDNDQICIAQVYRMALDWRYSVGVRSAKNDEPNRQTNERRCFSSYLYKTGHLVNWKINKEPR